MNKIQCVSLFFRLLFQLIGVTLPIVWVLSWTTDTGSLSLAYGAINISFIPDTYANSILHVLTNADKLLGFCLSILPILIELFIIYSLIKLFRMYEKGKIFSLKNVCYIRNIGWALFVSQLTNPIYEILMGIVLTAHNPPGQRFAKITFNQTNLSILLIALLVILISWIMMQGYQLQEEQQLTI